MENTAIQNQEIEPRYGEDSLEDNVSDYDPSTQVKDYDSEKYKTAVWTSVQNVSVFRARVSGEEFLEKGITTLIGIIQDKYDIDEVTFELGQRTTIEPTYITESFISWELEGQKKHKSKIHIGKVDDEFEITIAINNLKKSK